MPAQQRPRRCRIRAPQFAGLVTEVVDPEHEQERRQGGQDAGHEGGLNPPLVNDRRPDQRADHHADPVAAAQR